MKFSIDTTPELIPCHIYDADGVEIEHVIWGDTETGECEGYVSHDGTLQLTEDKSRILRYHRFFKAPLKIVKCDAKHTCNRRRKAP